METLHWGALLLLLVFSTSVSAERFSPWVTELNERENETVVEVRNTSMTWWEAARQGCDDVNPDGVMAGVEGNVSLLLEAMEDGQEYWIGVAKTTGSWKWRDNTRLYKYNGFSEGSVISISRHTIADNEVFLCAVTCETQFIGLQGTTCFCLVSIAGTTLIPNSQQFACPGSHEELCGNQYGVAIYESEAVTLIRWKNEPREIYNGQTTYLRLEMNVNTPYLELTTSVNPSLSMYFLCTRDGLYGSFGLLALNRTWAEAWQVCLNLRMELGHVHGANRAEIQQAMVTKSDTNLYWIGLFRNIGWRRLDGSQVALLVNGDDSTSTTRQCLTVEKSNSALVYRSRDCVSQHKVLCRIPVIVPTTTPAPPTLEPRASLTPEVRVVEVIVNNSVTGLPGQVQSLVSETTDSFTIVTMAIGLAACVMVIIVLVILLAVRRKRQKDLLGLPEAPKKFPPNVVFNPVFKRAMAEDEEAVMKGRPMSTISTYDLNDFSRGGDPNSQSGLRGRPESNYYNSLSLPRVNSPRQGGARPVSRAFNSILAACPEVAGDDDIYDSVNEDRLLAPDQGTGQDPYSQVPTTPDRGVPANSEYVYFSESSASSSLAGFPLSAYLQADV